MANEQNLKKFTSTYQPKNNGRKPSKLKKYIKENNLGIDDIRLMMKEVLAMDEVKLREKVQNKKEPMMIRLFIRAYLDDFKRGTLNNIEKMIDRIYGKSDQNINMQASVDVTQITPEERRERINEYIRKRDEENQSNVQGGGNASD